MPYADPAREREYHKLYVRRWKKAKYHQRRRAGVCAACGAAFVKRYANCRRCREKATTRHLRRHKRLREAGRCRQCAKPAVPGRTRCQGCADKGMIQKRQYRRAVREE